jgi:hypothetical protein
MDAPKGGSLEGLVAVDGGQEKIGRVGCDLINRLFVLTRNTLLFDLNNDALDRPVTVFLEALGELAELGEAKAALGVVGDNLSLNKGLLKPDPSTYRNGQFLHGIYRRLGAQEMVFDSDLAERDLRSFMAALREVVEGADDVSALSQLAGFQLVPLSEVDAAGEDVEIDRRIQVLRTFAGAVSVISRVMALADSGARWSPSLIRRVAHDLADASAREPDLALALLHLPVAGRRLGMHLVRTAVLSLLCTAGIGLPRRACVGSAMIALCHHLSRPSEEGLHADASDSAPGQTDPLAAALALCSRSGLNEGLIRCVVGIYEAAGRGDDRLYHAAESNDLLGRVTSLADRFSNLLDTLLPDEALRLVVSERREQDPPLCQVFVNTVGLYPVGSVVELESGAVAVVIKAPRRREQLLRPVVQVVRGASPAVVDLSEDAALGAIVRTRDPLELGENVVHYFLL